MMMRTQLSFFMSACTILLPALSYAQAPPPPPPATAQSSPVVRTPVQRTAPLVQPVQKRAPEKACALLGPYTVGPRPPADNEPVLAAQIKRLLTILQFPKEFGAQLSELGKRSAWEPDKLLHAYCPEGAKELRPIDGESCAHARMRIGPDGHIIYSSDGTQPGTFCLDSAGADGAWGPRIIVRARRSKQSNAESFCFQAAADRLYSLRSLEPTESDPVANLHIWASPANSDVLLQSRKSALAQGRGSLEKLTQRWLLQEWAVLLDKKAQLQSTVKLADFEQLADLLAQQAKQKLDLPEWLLDATIPSVMREIKDNAPDSIASYEELCRFTSSQLPDGAHKPRSPYLLASALKLALGPEELAFLIGLPHQPPHDFGVPWTVFEGQVPAKEDSVSMTYAVPAGSGHRTANDWLVEKHRVLLFGYDLPRDIRELDADGKEKKTTIGGRIAIYKGSAAPESEEFAKIIGTLILLVSQSMSTMKSLGLGAEPVREATCERLCLDTLAELAGRVLSAAETSTGRDKWLASATQATPTARFFADAKRSPLLEGNFLYKLQLCQGVEAESCKDDTSDDKITAVVTLRVHSRPSAITTATELAYSYAPSAINAGGYEFQQVGGGAGPDVFYRLSSRGGLEKQFSISQLLVLRPFYFASNRVLPLIGVALGPTLWEGADNSFLRQFNMRLVWEPWFARYSMLTVGASVRSLEVPSELHEGTTFAVSKGEAAPAFAKEQRWLWMFSVGIAVDWAVIGKVTDTVGNLFKKPAAGRAGGQS